jgi:ABC-type sugar transport system permease subunit
LYISFVNASQGENGLNYFKIESYDTDGNRCSVFKLENANSIAGFAVSAEKGLLAAAANREKLGENYLYIFEDLNGGGVQTVRFTSKLQGVSVLASGEIAVATQDSRIYRVTKGIGAYSASPVAQTRYQPVALFDTGGGIIVCDAGGAVAAYDYGFTPLNAASLGVSVAAAGFGAERNVIALALTGGDILLLDGVTLAKAGKVSAVSEPSSLYIAAGETVVCHSAVSGKSTVIDVSRVKPVRAWQVLRIPFFLLAGTSCIACAVSGYGLGSRGRERLNGFFKRSKRVFLKNWKNYAYILPAFILLVMFMYIPAVWGLGLSFFHYLPGVYTRFAGLANFSAMFSDALFWQGMANMLIFLGTDLVKAIVPGLIIVELIVALNSKRLQYWARVLLYLPGILPGVAALLIWRTGIYAENGLLNQFLLLFGAEGRVWLNNPATAKWALVFMGFPFVGSFLLFYGAVTGIPPSLKEAAKIDGAGYFRSVFAIDVPLITPQIKYVFIISFIGSIQDFGRVYMTTGGTNDTNVPALQMYLHLNQGNNFGLAAAMGMFLFVIIFAATVFNLRLKTNDLGV